MRMENKRFYDLEDPFEEGWRTPPPTPGSILRMILRQTPMIVMVTILCGLVAMGLAILSTPLYTARVSLYVGPDGGAEIANEAATAIDLDTQAELIRSDPTTLAVVDSIGLDPSELNLQGSRLRAMIEDLRVRLGLTPPVEAADDQTAALIQAVRNGLSVSRVGNTRIIEIGYTAATPEIAATLANAYADVQIGGQMDSATASAERRIGRLEDRADSMRALAAEADARMREILRRNSQPFSDPTELQNEAAALRQRLTELERDASLLQSEVAIRSEDGREADPALLSTDDPASRQLLSDLYAAQDRLAELEEQEARSEPAIAAINENIRTIQARIAQEIRFGAMSSALALEANEAEQEIVRDQIGRLNELLTSEDWADLEAARRDRTFYETAYQDYLARLEATERDGPSASALRVVATALPPSAPSSPDYKIVLAISVVLGLVIGIAIAAIREWNRSAAKAA